MPLCSASIQILMKRCLHDDLQGTAQRHCYPVPRPWHIGEQSISLKRRFFKQTVGVHSVTLNYSWYNFFPVHRNVIVLKQQEVSLCGAQVAYTVDSITDRPTEHLSICFLHIKVIKPL